MDVNPIAATDHTTGEKLDKESRDWIADLRSGGVVRDHAIERLHDMLLTAARFEVRRRRAQLALSSPEELEEIAHDASGDALLSVLSRLDDFRGLSRFRTWAYKFALLEASVKVRKRAWRAREGTIDNRTWETFAIGGLSPGGRAEQHELLQAIQRGIAEALTVHQRRVLIALALNGVPIDVLAEELGTTRGALYKTLHDARKGLRRFLSVGGFDLGTAAAGGTNA